MSLFSYIKQQVPIMDEVGRYVQLKPAGTYYKGPCPFHRETDASFTVSPEKQIFYCFGCHTSGDVISFVAKAENLTPIEAVHYLVDAHQLTIPESIAQQAAQAGKKADEKANYFSLCRVVAEWMHKQLQRHAHALEYVRKRAITDETITRFGMGYMPGGAQSMKDLVQTCIDNNILVKDLITAGVLFESRTSLRSPFEERILFPITDALGRNCGFGGRVFVPNDERAKYYNSKESPFFIKGTLLFGYALAKKAIQEHKAVFLVEGYTDCVALAQHGYPHVVATLGTACTLDHLQLLARSVDKVYVLYDGDGAGHKAMLRMAQLCWQVNLELLVVSLPGGLDPAEYLQKNDDLSGPVAAAEDIFSFFVRATAGDFENKSLADKMRAVEAILAMLARVADMVKQEILLQQASSVLQVPVTALRTQLQQQRQPAAVKTPVKSETAAVGNTQEQENIQEQIIALSVNSLLQKEALVIPVDGYEYFAQRYVEIFKLCAQAREKYTGQECFEALLAACSDSDRDWLIGLTMKYSGMSSPEEFIALVSKVVQQGWKEQVSIIRGKLEQASQSGNAEEMQKLVQQFARLKQQMQQKGLIWQKKQPHS